MGFLSKLQKLDLGFVISLHACFLPVPSGISHSVTSDMQTIEQETPTVAKPKKKYVDDVEDSYFSSSPRYSLNFWFWMGPEVYANSIIICTVFLKAEMKAVWTCLHMQHVFRGIWIRRVVEKLTLPQWQMDLWRRRGSFVGKWCELCVCGFYLVQSLVSACTDSFHRTFICYIPNPVNFLSEWLVFILFFFLSFFCYSLQIKQALRSDITCTTVASFSACQMQKLQSFWNICAGCVVSAVLFQDTCM